MAVDGIEGEEPVSKHHISVWVWITNGLAWDGTVEPVSRDQIIRRERGQAKNMFLCSVDHEQDWQPYPVGPSSATVF